MALSRKYLAIAIIIVIVGGLLVILLPSMMVVPPEIEKVEARSLVYIDGKPGLEALAVVVNKAGVDVVVKSAELTVYYGDEPVGRMVTGDFPLPSGRPTTILGFITLENEDVLSKALSEMLGRGFVNLRYEGSVEVLPAMLPVKVGGIKVSGSFKFMFGVKVASLFSVEKIETTGGLNLLVRVLLSNPLQMGLRITDVHGKIKFLGNPIGVAKYDKPIDLNPGSHATINMTTTPYNLDTLSLVIRKLIENRSLNLIWDGYLTLDFLGIKPEVHFETAIPLALDFNFRTIVGGVAFISSSDKVDLTVGVKMRISENFDVRFKINTLAFEAYSGGVDLGSGYLKTPAEFAPDRVTNLTVTITPNKANLDRALKTFFSGGGVIELRDVSLELEVFQRVIGVKLSKPLSINMSVNPLDVEVKAKFESINVDKGRGVIEVGFKAFVDIRNVENLRVKLYSPKATMEETVSHTVLQYVFSDAVIQGGGSWIPVKLTLDLNDPKTKKIADIFFSRGFLKLRLRHLDADAELLGTTIHVSADINADIEAYPITIFSIYVESGRIESLGGGRFRLVANVTTRATNYNVNKLFLKTVRASLYNREGTVLLARNMTLEINRYVPHGNITFRSQIVVEIERQAVEWFASRMFGGANVTVLARHIEVDVDVQGWSVTVPLKDTPSNVTITSSIVINVETVDVLSPGNVVDAELEITLSGVNVPSRIDEMSFDLENLNGKVVGSGRLLRALHSFSNGTFRGLFEVTFKEDYVSDVLSKITHDGFYPGYGVNVHIKGFVDSIPYDTTINKTVLLSIVFRPKVTLKFTIVSFTLENPGNVVKARVGVSMSVEKVNVPYLTVREATFEVFDISGKKLLGYGEFSVTGSGRIENGEGQVMGDAKITFNADGLQLFASKLLSVGKVSIRVREIAVTMSLMEEDVTVYVDNQFITYTAKPLKVSVTGVRLRSFSIYPPSATAEADIKLSNPFNFPIKIVSRGGKPTVTFKVFDYKAHVLIGTGSITQGLYLPPSGSAAVNGIPVRVPSGAVVFLYTQRRHGHTISFWAYATGTGVAQLYRYTVTFNFRTEKVYVSYSL